MRTGPKLIGSFSHHCAQQINGMRQDVPTSPSSSPRPSPSGRGSRLTQRRSNPTHPDQPQRRTSFPLSPRERAGVRGKESPTTSRSEAAPKVTVFLLALFLSLKAWPTPLPAAPVIETDLCVFGGTSGGIAAAIQASRMGKAVVLAEPGRYLGGLTTGGLGATDIGNKAAIGGISREFYHRIARHYSQRAAWSSETADEYFKRNRRGQAGASSLAGAEATMWTFEPHVAEQVYYAMLCEARVPLYFGQRLAAVKKDGKRIVEFTTEGGRVFRARMFIDATYEGDLTAKAGVSFHVGREANATFGETLNGVRAETPHHQFIVPVDPYLKPGDPKSGLLPFIQPGDGGRPGDGDRSVQAYNYRLCFTTNQALRLFTSAPPGYNVKKFEDLSTAAKGRLPVLPPRDYDPRNYELLARYLEALVAAGKQPQLSQFWNPIWMPNHKTDINNNGGFSTDFIGRNYDYPNADYATRDKILLEHLNYIRGFLTFLATSPRVPDHIRAEMQTWGPCQDEFLDTTVGGEFLPGWPRQLYVREARRMNSDYVMTEHDCRGKVKAEDPVGLGAYGMDSHNCQRVVKNGEVENEGDVQVHGFSPYPVAYRSIVPKAAECDNLFVPVCLSATHIAYGSIRMEPVFMILGQSSATAAALAIDDQVPVQKVNYAKLRARLLADKQVLEWTGPMRASGRVIDPKSLPGVVLDDADGIKTGEWGVSTSAPWQVGGGYLHDGNANKGTCSITFTPDLPSAGQYEIRVSPVPNPNRATNVPVTISVTGATVKIAKINQKVADKDGWISLGKFALPKGKQTTVTLSNKDTDGYVIADGVQFLPVK